MNIAITGIGIISHAGINIETTRSVLHCHDSLPPLNPPTLFKTSLNVPVGEVPLNNEELRRTLPPRSDFTLPIPCSRTALLGIHAALQALTDAFTTNEKGLPSLPQIPIGIISGSTVGGMDLSEQFYSKFMEAPSAADLNLIRGHDCADSTQLIARYCGLTGLTSTLSTACSSSANAILLATRLIEQGQADILLAGGCDALCRFTLNGFASLKLLDPAPCRPFAADRAGLNLGEGAAYLVLQSTRSIESALRKDIFPVHSPYGYFIGGANRNDAFHQTASSEEGTGPLMAMTEAIQMAKLTPDKIDYINAHGTGTRNNDMSESNAIASLFSKNSQGIPPFSSTKPLTGHTLGAAGAIEAVLSLLMMQEGILFPNLNMTTPDPLLPAAPLKIKSTLPITHILSNSFGFGGNDTSLIFSSNSSHDTA